MQGLTKDYTGQQCKNQNWTMCVPNASKPASAKHRAAARGHGLRYSILQLQLYSQRIIFKMKSF